MSQLDDLEREALHRARLATLADPRAEPSDKAAARRRITSPAIDIEALSTEELALVEAIVSRLAGEPDHVVERAARAACERWVAELLACQRCVGLPDDALDDARAVEEQLAAEQQAKESTDVET